MIRLIILLVWLFMGYSALRYQFENLLGIFGGIFFLLAAPFMLLLVY